MKNYILGKGEAFLTRINKPSGGDKKDHPYEKEEAIQRLSPRVKEVISKIDSLPTLAKPQDMAVIKFILHPAYLAKTYFPSDFFSKYDLSVLGSKEVKIVPEKWSPTKQGKLASTLSIFTAGKVQSFKKISRMLDEGRCDNDQIKYFEDITIFESSEKEKGFQNPITAPTLCEIVLQAPSELNEWVVSGFEEYLETFDISINEEDVNYQDGLVFIPVVLGEEQQKKIEDYSFLRVIRPMPEIRFADDELEEQTLVTLKTVSPLSEEYKVAIFDGGYCKDCLLDPFVTYKGKMSVETEAGKRHGTMVTSAYLFGNLKDVTTVAIPPAPVDCWQVYEPDIHYDIAHPTLYKTIKNIAHALRIHPEYQLVNLSIGPRMPVQDDEITLWTSTIDKLAVEGNRLIITAVGNDGALDHETGKDRIQPPSDGVNVLSVGSANSEAEMWKRAKYSCVGKNRSPGVIKPDLMDFGGGESEPFYSYYRKNGRNCLVPVQGTSFAAPNVLHKAATLKSVLGEKLTPLAIKALLIHNATKKREHSIAETGWGRAENDIEKHLLCKNNQVTILCQDKLTPKKTYRINLLLPQQTKTLGGGVKITITLCYFTDVDPAHPSEYTRNSIKLNLYKGTHLDDKGKTKFELLNFLESKDYKPDEQTLRSETFKWETTIKHTKKFTDISGFTDPFFTLHYTPRIGGMDNPNSKPLQFAFIMTLESDNDQNLYNHAKTEFTILEELRPILRISATPDKMGAT